MNIIHPKIGKLYKVNLPFIHCYVKQSPKVNPVVFDGRRPARKTHSLQSANLEEFFSHFLFQGHIVLLINVENSNVEKKHRFELLANDCVCVTEPISNADWCKTFTCMS